MDLALTLLRRGYRALPEERERHDGADTFETRLLARRAVVVRGRSGAELFYDRDVVQREGAVPAPLAHLIFGRGALHGLDGAAHAERKAVFLGLLGRDDVERICADVAEQLQHRLREAAAGPGRIDLFPTLVEVFGDAVQRWAGVPEDVAARARSAHRMAEIVDGIGFAGTAYLRAWRARRALDRWARDLIAQRRKDQRPRPDAPVADVAPSPLDRIAAMDLDDRTAGVELLNLLRPTVAVAWPASWAVVTAVPEVVARLRGTAGDEVARGLAHETRRLVPFVPALAGRVRRVAVHDGVRLRSGDRIVLDVPGTNTDPAWWSDAREVRPERHVGADPDPYAFVPQGGGYPEHGHRCPGEPLTVALISTVLTEIARFDLEPAGSIDDAQPITRIPLGPGAAARFRVSAT